MLVNTSHIVVPQLTVIAVAFESCLVLELWSTWMSKAMILYCITFTSGQAFLPSDPAPAGDELDILEGAMDEVVNDNDDGESVVEGAAKLLQIYST